MKTSTLQNQPLSTKVILIKHCITYILGKKINNFDTWILFITVAPTIDKLTTNQQIGTLYKTTTNEKKHHYRRVLLPNTALTSCRYLVQVKFICLPYTETHIDWIFPLQNRRNNRMKLKP